MAQSELFKFKPGHKEAYEQNNLCFVFFDIFHLFSVPVFENVALSFIIFIKPSAKHVNMNKPALSKFLPVMPALMIAALVFISCHSTKSLNGDGKKTAGWYQSREWLNGLQLIPHQTINQEEFSRQYHKNRVWWDEAFAFMKTHDLAGLKPGQYIIDSNNVIATVSEGPAKELDEIKWEAHRKFNDLQYIIKGKVKMGINPVPAPNATVTVPYSESSDVENYSVTDARYYDAEPGTFFIFSPRDSHRPAIRVEGYDMIKKIVIKVRVP